MNAEQAKNILDRVKSWAEHTREIEGVALIGSWARGCATPESDLDLIIFSQEAAQFRTNKRWLAEFCDAQPRVVEVSSKDVSYGAVWSRHVHFAGGEEVEFSFAKLAWLKCDPIDAGTAAVVGSGIRVVFDRYGAIGSLIERLRSACPQG